MEQGGPKKIILIGKTGSGKTTLIQRIEQLSVEYHKTQTVRTYLNFIDTPGEYLENRAYYKALIVTAADADAVGLVEDCSSDQSWLPPMFSTAFSPKEAVGIVTKVDLAADPQAVCRAEKRLVAAGASRIFRVSAVQGAGIEALTEYITAMTERG